MMDTKTILDLAENNDLLEVGRRAIEDALIDFRDSRISEFTRNNGFVVKESDGKPSDVIRFGPETGLKIALRAIAKHIEATAPPEGGGK